jgi:hypothetical protein
MIRFGSLDHVDSALRATYRRLAQSPDAATEYETALRELQRKRLCTEGDFPRRPATS